MAVNSSGKRGPRAHGTDTRGAILEAAREAFNAGGYTKTSMRQIGAAAGVDPSLVSYYFGSKRRLYMAAIQPPEGPAEILKAVLDRPVEEMGEALVRGVVTIWSTAEARASVQGVLRSLSEREDFGAFVVQYAIENVLHPWAQHLGGTPEAYYRVSLAGTQLLGLGLGRYFVLSPVIDELDGQETEFREGVERMVNLEALIKDVSATVQHYLTGELTREPWKSVGTPDENNGDKEPQ